MMDRAARAARQPCGYNLRMVHPVSVITPKNTSAMADCEKRSRRFFFWSTQLKEQALHDAILEDDDVAFLCFYEKPPRGEIGGRPTWEGYIEMDRRIKRSTLARLLNISPGALHLEYVANQKSHKIVDFMNNQAQRYGTYLFKYGVPDIYVRSINH